MDFNRAVFLAKSGPFSGGFLDLVLAKNAMALVKDSGNTLVWLDLRNSDPCRRIYGSRGGG
jgi:hypothetical protein